MGLDHDHILIPNEEILNLTGLIASYIVRGKIFERFWYDSCEVFHSLG